MPSEAPSAAHAASHSLSLDPLDKPSEADQISPTQELQVLTAAHTNQGQTLMQLSCSCKITTDYKKLQLVVLSTANYQHVQQEGRL